MKGMRDIFALSVQRVNGVTEAVGTDTVGTEPIVIYVGDQQRPFPLEALRLGQQRAVLGNEAMPAEDHIGRRFPHAARSIGIGRHAPARLIEHELPAITRLANHLIAGRQVQ